LKQWPAGGPPLAWKTTGLGSGYSTISVAAGRIFTVGDKGDSCFVIALSVGDGKPIWNVKLAPSGAPGWGSFEGPRNSPTVDGKLLWRAARQGQVAVVPTPIVQKDLVYVSSSYGIGCNLFQITGSGSSFKAKEVYANKVMVNHHGGVIKVGTCLYGYSDGKGWTCQDFKSGASQWAEKEKLGKGS